MSLDVCCLDLLPKLWQVSARYCIYLPGEVLALMSEIRNRLPIMSSPALARQDPLYSRPQLHSAGSLAGTSDIAPFQPPPCLSVSTPDDTPDGGDATKLKHLQNEITDLKHHNQQLAVEASDRESLQKEVGTERTSNKFFFGVCFWKDFLFCVFVFLF